MVFLRHTMNCLQILRLETSKLIYFDVQISPNPMYKIVSHTYFSMVSGLNPFGFEAITKTWDARYINALWHYGKFYHISSKNY